MPAIIPAVAGLAAAGWATAGFTIGIMGMGMMASAVVVGALAGAVVGGIQSAITGGDIGEGLLYGAVGGAVGGALGGLVAPAMFGSAGTATATNVTAANSYIVPGAGQAAGVTAGSSGWVPSAAAAAKGTAGSTGLLGGMSETTQLMLAQGGIQAAQGLMGGDAGDTMSQQTTSNEKITQMKTDNDLAIAKMTMEQRQREAELADRQAKDLLGFKGTELDKTIAQRQSELQTPYQEAAAARERQRNTATALTLSRQQQEATRPTEVEEEIKSYVMG